MVKNMTCAYLGLKRKCQKSRIIFLFKSQIKKNVIAETHKSRSVDLSSQSANHIRESGRLHSALA